MRTKTFGHYWQYILMCMLAIGYPIGKIMGIMVVGPRFVRWYLADLCWVPLFAFMGMKIKSIINMRGYPIDRDTILRANRWANFGFFVAIMQELATIFIQSHYVQRTKSASQANGDWMDIVCYISMYVVTIILLSSIQRTLDRRISLQEEEKRKSRRKRKEGRKKRKKL